MSKIISAVLTLSLLVTFTAPTHPALAGGDKKKDVPQRIIESRVYIRKQCILSATDPNQKESSSDPEFVAALAAIFLPFLIKKALGGASAALKKAGSPETLRDSGRLPTYLYKVSNKFTVGKDGGQTREKKIFLNPDLGCAIVVRGSFDEPDPIQGQLPFEPTAVKFPQGDSGPLIQAGDDQKRVDRLRLNGIKVKTIDAVFEAAIKISDDLSAMYYEARFLQVNSFQGPRSSKSGRGLVVSLAIHAPSSREGESVISLSLMNLGDVTIGEIRGPERLNNVKSSWLSGVGISDEAVKVIEVMQLVDNQTKGLMPITIEGTLVETEAGNATLRFIADVLDSTKDDVTKTVSDEILKDRNKETEDKAAAAADALEKLRQAEEESYGNYLEANAEFTASPAPTTPAEVAAQKVKEFNRDRTKRLWCAKFNALQTIGNTPAGRSCP